MLDAIAERFGRIIERIMTQEALLEAKQFSEQIVNSAQEGVIVYDLDLRYRVWNPFMERLTGMTTDEMIGRHPWGLPRYWNATHRSLLSRPNMYRSLFAAASTCWA